MAAPMNRVVEANLSMIRHVGARLGHLRDRVVFLGGAATALLITDSAALDVRVTIDVDVIVEIPSRGDYYRQANRLNMNGMVDVQGGGLVDRQITAKGTAYANKVTELRAECAGKGGRGSSRSASIVKSAWPHP